MWNFFCRLKPWEQFCEIRGTQIKLCLLNLIGLLNRLSISLPKPVNVFAGRGGEIDLSPSLANQASSNFKEENKLGEGGFGSVFKVSV